MCVIVFMRVCVFRTFVGVSSEPIRGVDLSKHSVQMKPSRTGSGFPRCSVPTPINTHHVRHISQRWSSHSRSRKGRRDLTIIHRYLWLLWRKRNPDNCSEGDATLSYFKFSTRVPLRFMHKVILLTNNHWSVICEFKYWSISSESWLYFFLCTESLNLIFLWLTKHLPAGEPQRHPL